MAKTELDLIRAFIKKNGPTKVERLTGITRRNLQLIKNEGQRPSYETLIKLREAMQR